MEGYFNRFCRKKSAHSHCTDGGPDGRIDDPIDTAFTSALLDSARAWYNINPEKIFVMGFSWGGRTTYTYGLRRTNQFAGFMPIGAAISGTNEFADVIDQAQDTKWAIIHGSFDSPGSRYSPAINGLRGEGACVKSVLMNGVGHTIDFPNRNEILTEHFMWLDSASCGTTTGVIDPEDSQLMISPNPVNRGGYIQLSGKNSMSTSWYLISASGLIVSEGNDSRISTNGLASGIYLLMIDDGIRTKNLKILVL